MGSMTPSQPLPQGQSRNRGLGLHSHGAGHPIREIDPAIQEQFSNYALQIKGQNDGGRNPSE